MTPTHRAVIEYAVPPRIEMIASGPRDFCSNALTRWLNEHPVTPYSDDDPGSGGMPMIFAVDSDPKEDEFFSLLATGLGDHEARETVWPASAAS